MLIKRRLLIFFMIMVSCNVIFSWNENDGSETDQLLSQKGYIFSENPFTQIVHEIQQFKEKSNEKQIDVALFGNIREENVTYYFIFLSKTFPNHVVVAVVIDENGKRKEYYKINTNNEPANTWVDVDMNGDGVIEEEEEGHIAWW